MENIDNEIKCLEQRILELLILKQNFDIIIKIDNDAIFSTDNWLEAIVDVNPNPRRIAAGTTGPPKARTRRPRAPLTTEATADAPVMIVPIVPAAAPPPVKAGSAANSAPIYYLLCADRISHAE